MQAAWFSSWSLGVITKIDQCVCGKKFLSVRGPQDENTLNRKLNCVGRACATSGRAVAPRRVCVLAKLQRQAQTGRPSWAAFSTIAPAAPRGVRVAGLRRLATLYG